MKSKSLGLLLTTALAVFTVPMTAQLRGTTRTSVADMPVPDPPGGGGFTADMPVPDPPGGGGFTADMPVPDPPGGGGFTADMPVPDPPGGGGIIG
ncbi:MAG TPA: hypothetical protein VIY69_08635 [Candidatus Acidoferrales bacterium]